MEYDWNGAQRIAYGRFRLTPEAFWRLTPAEWWLMLEGIAEERKQQNRRIAEWMSPLLSATCGHTITAGQLLGEEAAESGEMSIEQKIRAGQKKVAEMERKVKRAQKQRAQSGFHVEHIA